MESGQAGGYGMVPGPRAVENVAGGAPAAASVVPGPEPSPTTPKRTRPLLWLAVGAAALVLVGLVVWGVVSTRSAGQWRDRALSAERDLSATIESRDGIAKERDGLQVELNDAKAKNATLDGQLEQVANEKAKLDDQKEALTQIVQVAPIVNERMASCADSWNSVAIETLNVAAAFPYSSFYRLDSLISNAKSTCSEAIAAARELKKASEKLAP